MIAILKKTTFGKMLYRLSRTALGRPLVWFAALLQHEAIQPAHLIPAHRRHNQQQLDILSRFEARTGKS
ncbi:hypothetical protein [Phaeobacter sp. HF9A]|uniref:hypothetical protein n=1 Tax=Phaeobacter sp. HF9A TaxID=2721561 RepID=UPI00142FC5C6|nr:hypothetical protein [Phaeobacter sp. HF9A]NIZ13201.1 hypothetical protein [Phaeobacter sp. HF9A]